MPKINVIKRPPPDYRGGTPAPDVEFPAQSMNLTWSWGSEPGSANIVYLLNGAPVTVGDWLTIESFGHTFYGVCKADKPKVGSDGLTRTLEFEDSRCYLDWDLIYGCFNKLDSRIVNGTRIRRWKHLLPANFNAWRWTFTTNPLTAHEILEYVFGAATVEDPWIRTYHADQDYPVYDIDCLQGSKLKAVLQEISDKQALVFTLKQSGRFDLAWSRKGEGTIPSFPADSDGRELGYSLSGKPTRVRILGERNIYQVHNIPMEKDWVAAWEAYYDALILVDAVFTLGKTMTAITVSGTAFAAGTPFTTIAASGVDAEQIVSRQLASARADEITVREFAALQTTPSDFYDFRRYAGACRMDMPAMLYVKHILLRAFKLPTGFSFYNANGVLVYPDSCDIANRLCAAISHDAPTGIMSWDINEAVDGRGYAIIKGYQIGKDMFKTLRPDRFDLSTWLNVQEIWQHLEFQVDESGDSADQQFILFDDPIITSADLIHWENGFATFHARPTITVPSVKVSLPIMAEKFSYTAGTGTRDDREAVQGLYAEMVQNYAGVVVSGMGAIISGMTEVPFFDGQYAHQKAAVVASTLLNWPYSYGAGGYHRHLVDGNTPTLLQPYMDRVSLSVGPGGNQEQITLTTEPGRRNYIPERDLDRRNRELNLIPGTAELRENANYKRLIAAGVSKDAQTKKTVTDALRGFLGGAKEPDAIILMAPAVAGGAATVIPVGTPLWKKPTVAGATSSNQNTLTRVVHPADTSSLTSVFVGVATRHNEPVDGQIPVVSNGLALVRVLGPIAVNATVGFSAANSYLVAAEGDDEAVVVGTAQIAITTADVKLIPVRISGGSGSGSGSGLPVWL